MMNEKILKARKISKEDFNDGLRAIDNNDLKIPRHFFVHYYFPNPTDAWQDFENEKFRKTFDVCVKHWTRVLSVARRFRKLEQKRLIDSNYCNKSDYNIIKTCKRIRDNLSCD